GAHRDPGRRRRLVRGVRLLEDGRRPPTALRPLPAGRDDRRAPGHHGRGAGGDAGPQGTEHPRLGRLTAGGGPAYRARPCPARPSPPPSTPWPPPIPCSPG